jgi:hypothetical protein
MNTIVSRLLMVALGLALGLGARAQSTGAAPPPSAPPQASAAELEKLVAPIALHPDPLIAIVLPASVYPLEIVQAARFIQDTNNIAKLDEQAWDENVKALAKFPDMIRKMNEDLTWTMSLGQAFVQQPKELMDTIQMLRVKASSAGVLKTTPQQVIVVTNTVIEKTIETKVVVVTNTVVQIQPANPQVVYVPTYPPTIYYPPPVYVGPPPVITFAVGVAVGAIIANNSCDWHGGGIYVGHHGVAVWGGGGGYHGDVDIDINRNVNINNNVNVNNNVNRSTTTAQKWQPDPNRMSAAGAPAARPTATTASSRGWGAGTTQATPANRPATQPARPSPATTAAAPRPAPATSSATQRASQNTAAARPAPSHSNPSAFGGMGGGGGARQSSARGSMSRGGGGGRRR